jgi:hypothetical protein
MVHSSTVKLPSGIFSALLFAAACVWDAEHACPLLQNEHKEVKVDEILGRAEAEKAIKDAMVRILCNLIMLP